MAKEFGGVKLRAVHRIESLGFEGKAIVIDPGQVFQIRDGAEVERLVRLGAAVPVEEEPAATEMKP